MSWHFVRREIQGTDRYLWGFIFLWSCVVFVAFFRYFYSLLFIFRQLLCAFFFLHLSFPSTSETHTATSCNYIFKTIKWMGWNEQRSVCNSAIQCIASSRLCDWSWHAVCLGVCALVITMQAYRSSTDYKIQITKGTECMIVSIPNTKKKPWACGFSENVSTFECWRERKRAKQNAGEWRAHPRDRFCHVCVCVC